ncbi:GNAT family N-acetyltransferase [Shouchella lonarensis]|uniref:Predicted N-acyltransferase, GNAT family n=1 Tax=Shouchella lonarensis TaxID=1464122 RepID=A0A1G6HU93_9BACI|nr:GNAT family N-acetyltransferase [Shouchella lonarensis]SDB97801.1 Predicted N-acyltransferase, GNAT family [Shouchella lonarensis]
METKKVTQESDLQIALSMRKEVFINEQGVPPEEEIDAFDTLNDQCEHVLVYENNQAIGTGRMRIVNNIGKLERICVRAPYRQLGAGKVIIEALEDIAREKELSQVKLDAQTHAEGFYQKLGYQVISNDIFMDAGIPHISMTKQLSNI